MSYYTIFDEVETVLTASATSSTAFPAASDLLILHNVASGKKFATTISAIASVGTGFTTAAGSGVTLATSNTTGTNISPTGLTILKSTGGSSTSWLLSDPTAPGQTKELIFLSSTTSTLYAVAAASASIQCTGGSSANLINFASTGSGVYVNWGQGVTMVSLTTTSWIVTNVQRNPTAVSSGCVLAVGDGPIFTSV